MQRTIADCGLDALVPSVRLADDIIDTATGRVRHGDAHYDCQGNAHSEQSECHDADVAIISDLLNGVEKYVCEYTSEGDYPDAYFDIINETSSTWFDKVKDWAGGEGWLDSMVDAYSDNEFDDDFDLEEFNGDTKAEFSPGDFIKEFYNEPDDDEVIKWIVGELDGSFDCEPHYDNGDWGCYNGDGLCLASYVIGEYEEHISISCYPELQALHDKGTLNDVLDDVNCDLYISRSKPRVKNEETGHYEYVGNETYNKGYYPYLLGYCSPPGQWHYVVDDERMEELLRDAYAALTTFDKEKMERFIASEGEGLI